MVVGVGNVAVDVARILAKTAEDLRPTDLPDHVLDVLNASHVTDIHVLGRRGPAQAKFTTKELRELGELVNADVIVREDELLLDEASEATIASDAGQRRNLDILRAWAAEQADRHIRGAPRIHLRFLVRPRRHSGGGEQVEGVAGRAHPARRQRRRPGHRRIRDAAGCRWCCAASATAGEGMAGLPFDERNGTIPNEAGRVMRRRCSRRPASTSPAGSSVAPPASSAPTSPTPARPSRR